MRPSRCQARPESERGLYTNTQNGGRRVAIIVGDGSGHEPAFAGYVGLDPGPESGRGRRRRGVRLAQSLDGKKAPGLLDWAEAFCAGAEGVQDCGNPDLGTRRFWMSSSQPPGARTAAYDGRTTLRDPDRSLGSVDPGGVSALIMMNVLHDQLRSESEATPSYSS